MVVPYIALEEILRFVAVESTTEIPYRTKLPLRCVAQILVKIATTVEGLVVIGDLLHNIEACYGVHIEVLPRFVRVLVAIDEVIQELDLLSEVGLLLRREHLRTLMGHPHGGLAAFFDGDMWITIVVVDLYEPTASDLLCIGLFVLLLHDIHAVFIHTDMFGQEVQTDIIAIHYHL